MSSESQEFQPQDENLDSIEIFSEEEIRSLTDESKKIREEQKNSGYDSFEKSSASEYGKAERLRATLKGHLTQTPNLLENKNLIDYLNRSRNLAPVWRGEQMWPTKKTVQESKNEALYTAWGEYSNNIHSNDRSGYLEVGMNSRNIRFDDDNDLKLHVNTEVAEMPVAMFALAVSMEKLKTEGIDMCFKAAALKRTAFQSAPESKDNPPRFVVYSKDQDPQKLQRILEVVNEALKITDVKDDPNYTPRYCEQVAEGSPIYLAQGKGNDKANDSSYRSQYGEDGLFKDNVRPVVDSLKNSLQN